MGHNDNKPQQMRELAEELRMVAGAFSDHKDREIILQYADEIEQARTCRVMPVDQGQHYREQAAELRKIANSASDDIIRKRLLKNAISCEQMAVALDTIAITVFANTKLTVGTPQHFKGSATLLAAHPPEPSRNY